MGMAINMLGKKLKTDRFFSKQTFFFYSCNFLLFRPFLGYCASCFIDYGASFIETEWSWRLPLLLQCVFALVLACGTFLLPESPRYLVKNERDAEALKVLATMYAQAPEDDDVQKEYNEIHTAVYYERTLGTPTWAEMFTTYRKRSFIAIAVQALGQLSGINIVTVSFQTPPRLPPFLI
jgi:hypothetical protein